MTDDFAVYRKQTKFMEKKFYGCQTTPKKSSQLYGKYETNAIEIT